MHITEKRIEIRAPVGRVFDLFSDFESFPRWMKNIREVRYTGLRYTRWAAEAPLGTEVEWEAETTRFEPDRRISWRSVRGDVDTEGEVFFEETERGTTLLRVVLGYRLPAGRLGEMVARLFGKDPEQQLEDDLERFALVAEGSRSRVSGRERDERERAFEERCRREAQRSRTRPIERRPRHIEMEREREPQRTERGALGVRERRELDYYSARKRTSDYDEQPAHRERPSRAAFDEALRAARRSQLDGQRRYAAEQRERGEHERGRDERGERRAETERDERRIRRTGFAGEERDRRLWEDERRERDERLEESRGRAVEGIYDEDDRPRLGRRRHAMTPRETERERERGREPDDGYAERAFRRGVEKLMDDEPPSRRWRRS